MSVPGFTAEASAYRSTEIYFQGPGFSTLDSKSFAVPALRSGIGDGAKDCTVCMSLCWLICKGVGESNCVDRCWNICCVETALSGGGSGIFIG
jgi:hypothetical protein